MGDLQTPDLDAYTVGFDSNGVLGMVVVLFVVGVIMVGGLFAALAVGREHPFRSEVDEDKKKKPPT